MMRNNLTKFFALLLLVCITVTSFASCDQITEIINGLIGTEQGSEQPETPKEEGTKPEETPKVEHVDYVAQLKLDMSSETLKQEVTVKQYIDGDTTHFIVPTTVMERGYIKARYLAINTPESTGKIEEWGKAAAKFTKDALSTAVSIIIESDNDTWNLDSTGDRHLLWIWYKPDANSAYRNLNLEILQNGYAIASNTAQNRYGDICMNALNQAKAEKLHVFSKAKDPNFYYGKSQEVTIKEIRTNIEEYVGTKVAFEGVITRDYNNGVYVEDYDEETNMYFGIYIYYGFGANYKISEILTVGNKVRIVGSLQFYEGGGTYQIADPNYELMEPKDPDNCQILGKGDAAYKEITAEELTSGKVTLTLMRYDEELEESVEVVETFDFGNLAQGTTVSMKNLKVVRTYTTNNGGDNDGAVTITCEVNGITVTVRMASPLKFADGTVIPESYFTGKTFDVKGVVDYYSGSYQIKLFSINDVVFH